MEKCPICEKMKEYANSLVKCSHVACSMAEATYEEKFGKEILEILNSADKELENLKILKIKFISIIQDSKDIFSVLVGNQWINRVNSCENITKYNKVIDEFNEALDFKFKHMNKILKELENK